MSVMRACEQDVMCISDTSDFALGTVMPCCRHSFHAGRAYEVGVGTVCEERAVEGNSPLFECRAQASAVGQEPRRN